MSPAVEDSMFPALWLSDLQSGAALPMDWLWRGCLAAGNVTLLTSQWKAGKTTLLSLLLDRLKTGGDLAGLPVKPGKAVVVSEEPASLWLERSRRFDFAEQVCWLCRPFAVRPGMAEWLSLVERLLSLHQQFGISLAAIDPISEFFPAQSESNADAMLAALLPLRRLTAEGMSVALLHHPRKKGGMDGQCARGSGVLCSHVDILLELHWYADAASDDRRRLLGWSRHEETPRHRIIELSADGRDYLCLGDAEEETLRPVQLLLWEVLKSVLTKLTREQIADRWPADEPKPAPATLTRALARAVERGELKHDGGGVRADPYYYWLPSLEELWKSDLVARSLQESADACRKVRSQFPGGFPE